MFTRGQLDQLVLDVELVLISVVQGVALSTHAIEGGPRVAAPDLLTLVFLATGLLFVLSFWSVAIIHAISFVAWPMDLGHYLFYFTLALLECLTFAQMDHPVAWFGWSLTCFVATSLLYVYDYRLILARRSVFEETPELKALHAHMLRQQRLEMTRLMPAGLGFNLLAVLVVRNNPTLALPFAGLQCLFTMLFVLNFSRSFTARRRLITAAVSDQA
jgi:hypothetical protein